MIVNSHYVPLQPPYPVIYCNGEVGMQIGTLIVVEGRDPSEPHRMGRISPTPYFIRTHSHPVVSYGNKKAAPLTDFPEPNDWSEGIVWDKVEMSKVMVLSYSSNPEIPHPRLQLLVNEARYNDAFRNQYNFKLSTLIRQFRRFNIQSPLSEIFKGVQLEPKVKVTFIKQTADSVFLYGVIDGFAPYLNIVLRWSENLDNMEEIIRNQIDDYRAAIAPHELQFSFDSQIIEWNPLAERLNKYYSNL